MPPQRRSGARAAAEADRPRICSGGLREKRSVSVKKSRIRLESQRTCLKTVLLMLLVTCVVLAGTLLWHYMNSKDDITEVLAHSYETVQERFFEVPCSEDYNNHKRFPGCTPRMCGRAVTDAIISREEAKKIQRVAEKGLSLGGSDGGASILDLHSGTLSMGKYFVNMYRYFGDTVKDIFSEEDFQLYRDIRQRVQQEIAKTFGISSSSMYLTKPTFFSRMDSTEAKTAHDEYWHPHVDKVTYGSFDYTSLLYLSDYTTDFGGGQFVFMDEGANKTIEPRTVLISKSDWFISSVLLERVREIIFKATSADKTVFYCGHVP
ncbi:2-oxoglutarate and iron-dependent oxygenase domain-containing protein 3 isoform X2 [Rhinatrema bivittatum]|uniref:2-oxoglutarate and iron-dependent oxygenase domain-containing protein 3 isoform X2 n=1 Tax=Rhinatrema bivittatum TaxID=194408 RepID=UPI00112890DD|nr:2-oxoglutarate and iron-dependent oxygenase domain-containing protein 3 isoform X2 [Rhinatrema bivittatum]